MIRRIFAPEQKLADHSELLRNREELLSYVIPTLPPTLKRTDDDSPQLLSYLAELEQRKAFQVQLSLEMQRLLMSFLQSKKEEKLILKIPAAEGEKDVELFCTNKFNKFFFFLLLACTSASVYKVTIPPCDWLNKSELIQGFYFLIHQVKYYGLTTISTRMKYLNRLWLDDTYHPKSWHKLGTDLVYFNELIIFVHLLNLDFVNTMAIRAVLSRLIWSYCISRASHESLKETPLTLERLQLLHNSLESELYSKPWVDYKFHVNELAKKYVTVLSKLHYVWLNATSKMRYIMHEFSYEKFLYVRALTLIQIHQATLSTKTTTTSLEAFFQDVLKKYDEEILKKGHSKGLPHLLRYQPNSSNNLATSLFNEILELVNSLDFETKHSIFIKSLIHEQRSSPLLCYEFIRTIECIILASSSAAIVELYNKIHHENRLQEQYQHNHYQLPFAKFKALLLLLRMLEASRPINSLFTRFLIYLANSQRIGLITRLFNEGLYDRDLPIKERGKTFFCNYHNESRKLQHEEAAATAAAEEEKQQQEAALITCICTCRDFAEVGENYLTLIHELFYYLDQVAAANYDILEPEWIYKGYFSLLLYQAGFPFDKPSFKYLQPRVEENFPVYFPLKGMQPETPNLQLLPLVGRTIEEPLFPDDSWVGCHCTAEEEAQIWVPLHRSLVQITRVSESILRDYDETAPENTCSLLRQYSIGNEYFISQVQKLMDEFLLLVLNKRAWGCKKFQEFLQAQYTQ